MNWFRLRQRLLRLTAGGRWTDRLPQPVQNTLRWFWFDGLFAQATEAILVTYLTLFVLALGASSAEIGLLSALTGLSAAVFLLPGAALSERWGQRKQLVVASGGIGARATLLLLALLPLVASGPTAVYIAIALAVIRSALAHFAMPAWTSLTADIVPLEWRGRYFASRNIAMGVGAMAVTYLVGYLITVAGSPAGYQSAMGLAFAAGLVSTYCFARIQEPKRVVYPQVKGSDSLGQLWRHLRAHPVFLAFCATTALWNFSLNVAGPFFNVYLVSELAASAGVVGLLTVATSLTSLPGQRLFGSLSDRWGARRVQMITGLLIPALPVAWIFVRSPWHVVPINLASGILWAGYLLSGFNLLLALSPEAQRAHFTAIYQIVVTVALAAGAAAGGFIVEHWGYQAVFVLSGVGRLAAALLFVRFVREPGPAPTKPAEVVAGG